MIPFRAAQLAGAAYPDKSFMTFEEQGFPLHAAFQKDGTEVYILEGIHSYVIVFRGTDEIKDWLTNMSIGKVNSPYGKVHAGFSRSVDNIYSQLNTEMLKLQEKPFVIIGHSKGAAEAVVMAERLSWQSTVDIQEIHLFGCPRVGNYEFAGNFNRTLGNRTFRYVNNNDIVCRIPSPIRFKHIGKRVYIDRTGHVRNTINGFKLTLDRLLGRFRLSLSDGIGDHDISRYANSLTYVA